MLRHSSEVRQSTLLLLIDHHHQHRRDQILVLVSHSGHLGLVLPSPTLCSGMLHIVEIHYMFLLCLYQVSIWQTVCFSPRKWLYRTHLDSLNWCLPSFTNPSHRLWRIEAQGWEVGGNKWIRLGGLPGRVLGRFSWSWAWEGMLRGQERAELWNEAFRDGQREMGPVWSGLRLMCRGEAGEGGLAASW